MMPQLTPQQKIANLADALVADLEAMTDEELRQELIDSGYDPDAEAVKVRDIFAKAMAQTQ